MTSSDIRRYEMFVRVRDFGETHAALFPKASLAQEQFAAVAAAATALSGHAVTKMAAAREGKSPKAAARLALIDHLLTIALTGRAMAQNNPELADKFRMPQPRGDQALIIAGRLFVKDAEALKTEFLAHAMSETFIADLTKAVDAFEAAIQERENGKSESAGARADIRKALAAGSAAVARLEAIVTNHLGNEPKTMAVWTRERRIGAVRRRRGATAESAPAAPAEPIPANAAADPKAA